MSALRTRLPSIPGSSATATHARVQPRRALNARPRPLPSSRPPSHRPYATHKRTPAPAVYGRYALLDPSTAMETYPSPRPVPESIPRPPYVPRNFFTAPLWEHETVEVALEGGERIKLGSEEEEGVRRAAGAVAEVLGEVGALVRPGITTDELDAAVHAAIVRRGAYPSPLGYSHFPRSCTTSVNNVIAHGIPDDRPLLADDIINIDITLFLNGFHGDTSATFVLPNTDTPGRKLVSATEEALELAIRACGPGKPYNGIGRVIEDFAKRHGLGVNPQFTGHGIGKRFHQEPWILPYRNSEEGVMVPGDCFTIEPALVQGTRVRGTVWDDGWTVSTDSGARSAQFEHQILITEKGADVLTRRSS